jgi:hypothetical protein
MTRYIEAQKSLPFYIAAGVISLVVAMLLIGSSNDCSEDDFDNSDLQKLLYVFKLFDFMSDWAFYAISLRSARFTEYGAMGAQNANSFESLQWATLAFCITGTFAFFADTRTIDPGLSAGYRKVIKGFVIVLEDIPQIILCRYYLVSVDANFQEDSLAIVSLVFSGLFLLINLCWVFACSCSCNCKRRSNRYTNTPVTNNLVLTATPSTIVAPLAALLDSNVATRCLQCNAKVQFCICNERRTTTTITTLRIRPAPKKSTTVVNHAFTATLPALAAEAVSTDDSVERDAFWADSQIVDAIGTFDTGNKGFVLASDLKKSLVNLGTPTSAEEADAMVSFLDPQGTGRINYPRQQDPGETMVFTPLSVVAADKANVYMNIEPVANGTLRAVKASSNDHPLKPVAVADRTESSTDDQSVYQAVADPAILLCQSHLVTSKKQCSGRQAASSMFCSIHTCQTKGCRKLKPSRSENCNLHNMPA